MHKPGGQKPERQEILALQYLRALSVIAIVMAHQFKQDMPIWENAGVGVDIFFIGSGFIMFVLTDLRSVTPGRFFVDRITRIVPLYWLATLICFAIVITGHQIWGATASIPHLLMSLFFIPADNGMGAIYPTIPYGWTLNYEMLYYIVFGLILFLPQKYRLAALSSMFIGLILYGEVVQPTHPIPQTYTDPCLTDFIAGGVLAQFFGMSLDRTSWARTLTGSAVVTAAMYGVGLVYPTMQLAWIGTLIFVAVLVIERLRRMPRLESAKFLGDASYAIYLFQGIAFKLVEVLLRQLDRRIGIDVQEGLLAQSLSIAAALAMGIAIHMTIEKPMTRFARHALASGKMMLSGRVA